MNCREIVRLRHLKELAQQGEERKKLLTADSALDDLHHEIRLHRKIKVRVKGFLWKHLQHNTLCLDTYSLGMYSFTYMLTGDLAAEIAKTAPEIADYETIQKYSLDPGDRGGEAATHLSYLYAELEGTAQLKETCARFQRHQPLKKSGGYLYDLAVSKVNWTLDLRDKEQREKFQRRLYTPRYISYGLTLPARANTIEAFSGFKHVQPETADIKDLAATKLTVESIHADTRQLRKRVETALSVAYKTIMRHFVEKNKLYLRRIYATPHLRRPYTYGTTVITDGLGENPPPRPYWSIEISTTTRKVRYQVFVDVATLKVVYASVRRPTET